MPNDSKNEYQNIYCYLKEDNEEAYRLLLKFCYKPIFGFVYNMIKDSAETEDIVQKTFIKLWENRDYISQASYLKPWLFLVAKNMALNFIALKKKRIPLHENTKITYLNPEQILHSRDVQYAYLKAIRKLPQPCQTVYKLAYLDHQSHQEIASKLGMNIKTVQYQLYKAVDLLKQELKRFRNL